MSYVKIIESNIQGGFKQELGPKTLIIGANGVGKTSVMRAVELALRGKTSDLIWRQNVASVEALAALAGPTTGVSASAVFDDGKTTATYVFGRKPGGGFTKPKHVLPEGFDPEAAFPLELFRAAALGSDAKLHAFLVRHATGEILLKDVLARVPPALHDDYNQIAAECPGTMDQIDVLLHVTAQAKARARKVKAEADGARDAAQSAMVGVLPPDEASLAKARSDVLAAQEMLEASIARSSQADAIVRAKEAAARVATLTEERRQLEAQLRELPQLTPDVRNALNTVLWHAKICREACIVCATPLDPNLRAERAAKARAKLDGHDKWPRVADRIADLDVQIAEARRHVQAPANAARPGVLPLHEAQRLAAAAQADLRALEDAELRYAQASRGRDAAVVLAEKGNRLAQLVESCRDAVALFLITGAATFSKKVQAFLPQADVFELRVDPASGACVYGLVRKGHLCSALSGAETIRVSAAVASAVATGRPGQPTLILGEDRAWDPASLTAALFALRESPAQIILPSTIEPEIIPTGWTVLRLAPRG